MHHSAVVIVEDVIPQRPTGPTQNPFNLRRARLVADPNKVEELLEPAMAVRKLVRPPPEPQVRPEHVAGLLKLSRPDLDAGLLAEGTDETGVLLFTKSPIDFVVHGFSGP